MSSKRFAVIGDPVDQSLSPVMQTAAFHAAGLDAQYEAIPIAPAQLQNGVRRLRAENFAGFNVTVPHKESIVLHLDEIEPLAREVGAVNTVVRSGQRLVGLNTDSGGFVQALRVWGVPVNRRCVLVLGAGGAGRAITHALLALGAARVWVANRRLEKAENLRRTFGDQVVVLGLRDESISSAVKDAGMVINATSAGMGDLSEVSPLCSGIEFSSDSVVVDLVYGRQTPFLRKAADRGCQTFDGLEMLVQQGGEAFRAWTGIEPDLDIMRQACRTGLQEVA